jgi:hypothetical protein
VTDGLFFLKLDGSTTMNFLVEKDNTNTSTAAGVMANDTFVTAGFFYDPQDRRFHIYWNDVEVASSVSTNAVDDEDITISLALQNGDANARTLTIDYVACWLER